MLLSTCGGEIPEPVTSTSNYLLVRYTNSFTGENKSSKPIKAKYSRGQMICHFLKVFLFRFLFMFVVCEMRVFGPDAGVLVTPNYPKPYPEGISCTFHIYGPADSVVVANFTDFNIAETFTDVGEDSSSDSMSSSNNMSEASKVKDESITYVEVGACK